MINEIDIIKFDSKQQFNDYLNSEDCRIRNQLEQLICDDNKDNESWVHYGYCECCEKSNKLLVDWQYPHQGKVNFRERLVCEECGLNNRQRFTFSYARRLIESDRNEKKVYLYEQVTSLYKQAKTQFSCDVIGSEYLGFEKKSGDTFDGIRHEDAMALSFDDGSLDLIISNDVFEHVPNIELSFQEASRTLKDNGTLLFTIPFYRYKEETTKRCELIDGNLVHYMDEEYHGNPIASDKGSLVFYNYSWDIMQICKDNGFRECDAIMYYGYFYGYLGAHFMFIAKK